MKELYYTPKIEEFHVGFELEMGNKTKNSTKWSCYVFESDEDLFYNGFKDPAEKRVKYLDKEDIESEGFELYSGQEYKKDNQVVLFSKGNYTLGHDVKDNLITIFITNPSVDGEFPKFIADSVKCTKIKVKNKSELKKLLKQLNVQ